MTALKTIAMVAKDGTITGKAPASVPLGEHPILIFVDESGLSEAGGRGFPDLAVFRESLGAPVGAGNTIVQMREDERS